MTAYRVDRGKSTEAHVEQHGQVNGEAATFATYRGRGALAAEPPQAGLSGAEVPGTLLEYLDRLTDRIDQLEFTLVELTPSEETVQTAQEAITDRLTRIEAQLDTLGDRQGEAAPDLGALVSHLNAAASEASATRAQVEGLDARLGQLDSIAGRLELLDRLQDQVAGLVATLSDAAPQDVLRPADVEAALAPLSDKLTALTAAAAAPDLSQVTGEWAQTAAAWTDLAPRIDAVLDRPQQTVDLSRLDALAESLPERLDSLAKAVAAAPPAAASLDDAASGMRTLVTSALDTLREEFATGAEALSTQITTAEKRLGSALRRKSTTLPRLDEIQATLDGLARQDTSAEVTGALSDLRQALSDRLDKLAAAQTMAEEGAVPVARLEHIGTAIVQMQKRLESNFRDRPTWADSFAQELEAAQVTGLQSAMSSWAHDLQAIAAAQTGLQGTVDTLAQAAAAPDAAPKTLEPLIERLAGAADRLAALPEAAQVPMADLDDTLKAHKSAVVEAVQQILTGAAAPAAGEQFDRLERASTAIEAAQQALSGHVANLSSLPDPKPLTEGLVARFDSETARVLDRLGHVTATLTDAARAQAETAPASPGVGDPATARQLIATVARLADSNSQLVDRANAAPEALYARQEQFLIDLRTALSDLTPGPVFQKAS